MEVDLFDEYKKSTLAASPLPMKKTRRKTELLELNTIDEYRRVFGVYQLLKVMGMEKPVAGKSYHILSGGHVDLLAHLQWIMLHWPKLRRVFLSAWAISSADILLCGRYLQEGTVGVIELLLGDVFPAKYKMEWKKLMELYEAGKITDIYTSSVHSKVMLIEAVDGTKIVIESSANCNMNPRIEQSCVTVSPDLFNFYDYYLHEVLESEEAKCVARETIKRQTAHGTEAHLTAAERVALLRED